MSFVFDEPDRLMSQDAGWSIRVVPDRGMTVAVEVKRNGRRRRNLCVDSITRAQADREVKRLIKQFAETPSV